MIVNRQIPLSEKRADTVFIPDTLELVGKAFIVQCFAHPVHVFLRVLSGVFRHFISLPNFLSVPCCTYVYEGKANLLQPVH